jgi:hypothetical protein
VWADTKVTDIGSKPAGTGDCGIGGRVVGGAVEGEVITGRADRPTVVDGVE